MVAKNDDGHERVRILAETVIQGLSLLALCFIIWLDSVRADNFQQVELLLAGVAAARPVKELLKQVKKDAE